MLRKSKLLVVFFLALFLLIVFGMHGVSFAADEDTTVNFGGESDDEGGAPAMQADPSVGDEGTVTDEKADGSANGSTDEGGDDGTDEGSADEE